MSTYSEELRRQSNALLQGAKQMLNALSVGPDDLKSKLLQIQSQPTIEAMRASIDLVVDSIDNRPDYERLVKATACLVTGNIYATLADQTDFLMQKGAMKTVVDRLRKRSSLNAAIRTAAAKGDWDEYDRLTATAIDLDLGEDGSVARDTGPVAPVGGEDVGGDQETVGASSGEVV